MNIPHYVMVASAVLLFTHQRVSLCRADADATSPDYTRLSPSFNISSALSPRRLSGSLVLESSANMLEVRNGDSINVGKPITSIVHFNGSAEPSRVTHTHVNVDASPRNSVFLPIISQSVENDGVSRESNTETPIEDDNRDLEVSALQTPPDSSPNPSNPALPPRFPQTYPPFPQGYPSPSIGMINGISRDNVNELVALLAAAMQNYNSNPPPPVAWTPYPGGTSAYSMRNSPILERQFPSQTENGSGDRNPPPNSLPVPPPNNFYLSGALQPSLRNIAAPLPYPGGMRPNSGGGVLPREVGPNNGGYHHPPLNADLTPNGGFGYSPTPMAGGGMPPRSPPPFSNGFTGPVPLNGLWVPNRVAPQNQPFPIMIGNPWN